MSEIPDRRCRTPGVMAEELGEPLHRVQYILDTRSHIKPVGRAGRIRVYTSEAVAQIRDALNAIDSRKARG